MIDIFRSGYNSRINEFYGRQSVKRDEVIIKHKKDYTYAEPSKEGYWAFGVTILYTSNGMHPEFNTPIKLHDRNMGLEG